MSTSKLQIHSNTQASELASLLHMNPQPASAAVGAWDSPCARHLEGSGSNVRDGQPQLVIWLVAAHEDLVGPGKDMTVARLEHGAVLGWQQLEAQSLAVSWQELDLCEALHRELGADYGSWLLWHHYVELRDLGGHLCPWLAATATAAGADVFDCGAHSHLATAVAYFQTAVVKLAVAQTTVRVRAQASVQTHTHTRT